MEINQLETGIIVHSPPQDGLVSQENWKAHADGRESLEVTEFPFFTDAIITGEIADGLGPYRFLNTVPMRRGTGIVTAPIILRASLHVTRREPKMDKKDEGLYHGGSHIDEIAALTSLCLGARIRAGGATRHFRPGEDILGRPIAWSDEPVPTIQVRQHQPRVPSAVGNRRLESIPPYLSTVPHLKPTQYVSLVRACKSYQDALWVAESEPNLAWLMFVSALETAAGEHNASKGSATERLRESKPEIVKLLESKGGADLVREVADSIEPSLGATKKFMDFTSLFLPAEPESRPQILWLRVNWTKTFIKKNVLKVIYSYRSRALHGGIPFPVPMLEPPFPSGDESAPAEIPLVGLAAHSRGGTWKAKDTPITLNCFHYIVRGALLNWWNSMIPRGLRAAAMI